MGTSSSLPDSSSPLSSMSMSSSPSAFLVGEGVRSDDEGVRENTEGIVDLEGGALPLGTGDSYGLEGFELDPTLDTLGRAPSCMELGLRSSAVEDLGGGGS